MKRFFIIALLGYLIITDISAQEILFKLELSKDTVLFGNIFELKYSIENTNGDFKAPEFNDFTIVSGPNVASQFSMINGQVTQSSSYSYYLRPKSEGIYHINEAYLENGENVWHTDPVTIVVMSNPDGIIHRPGGFGFKKEILVKDSSMTKQDSLRLKLKNLKTYKI